MKRSVAVRTTAYIKLLRNETKLIRQKKKPQFKQPTERVKTANTKAKAEILQKKSSVTGALKLYEEN